MGDYSRETPVTSEASDESQVGMDGDITGVIIDRLIWTTSDFWRSREQRVLNPPKRFPIAVHHF